MASISAQKVQVSLWGHLRIAFDMARLAQVIGEPGQTPYQPKFKYIKNFGGS